MGLDDVLRALSDPTRREVVRLLARSGPMTAGGLAERFDLAKSTMSGHFNVLRQAGLVVAERQGTRVVYSASLSVVEEAMAAVMDGLGIGRDAAVSRGTPRVGGVGGVSEERAE
jgi:DNA-binding transcriptional ArsR family regulator